MNVYRNNSMYLIYSENTTHTGTTHNISWTPSLQKASVLSYLDYKLRCDLESLGPIEILPVKVTRNVSFVNE